MLMLWPPYRRRVLAEADEYIESFGERAWDECHADYVFGVDVQEWEAPSLPVRRAACG